MHTHTYKLHTHNHSFVMEQLHNNKPKMAVRPRSLWFRIQNYKHSHVWWCGKQKGERRRGRGCRAACGGIQAGTEITHPLIQIGQSTTRWSQALQLLLCVCEYLCWPQEPEITAWPGFAYIRTVYSIHTHTHKFNILADVFLSSHSKSSFAAWLTANLNEVNKLHWTCVKLAVSGKRSTQRGHQNSENSFTHIKRDHTKQRKSLSLSLFN